MSAGPVTPRGTRVLVSLLALAMVFVAGCGGGSTDEPGGVDISSGDRHLDLVAYAVPKIGFDEIIPAFRDTPEGHDIGFSASYGASGDQSRKVARRVPADVVNFSVEPDITRLVKAGLVDEDWKKQAPNNSTPFGSVVALVVRKGNPKGIRDWDDLLKPGVQVVTPNPGSSGSAKWNLLAPYAALSDGGRDSQAGLDYVAELVRDHIKVVPKSGREATTAFEQGQGDVLISYENEAIMLDKANSTAAPNSQVEYVIPPQTFKIENPVAVVNTSDDKAGARSFVDFLFTPEAQLIWAEQGFRPVDPAVIEATRDLFPGDIAKLWTIAELGKVLGEGTAEDNDGKDLTGWKAVDEALFGKKGAITKIYDSGGKQ
ncbi:MULTISPECIES: sulfate ABC transporter substrate-binding protein [Gordonia]|uniref:sulfate ABC transporter substrate-binding protein n=1 Tax=Gordonia TaxID=2053 RepID=UPI000400679B|nr:MULTISPECIES: sulfate ABC transporter substrate-binding protein [Gordonia]MDH3008469.1 sulfate ABC transporter substrate-binding protein [Gordonia alkanivorans]MDH3015601.1 sulfate ABC transporter substrate-binding protein [Gordonia alkanivorans]MDH3020335.1 sulfate ABC transporter substrate-binding protein [Gordonia alkanivorans]MDH3023905.1 sulfate ABC transporter substrate-binding protein [Gordonia alkanivorans]MDH3040251.1 sulfate ABC transporter substrate-binding protein [Gordonia alka